MADSAALMFASCCWLTLLFPFLALPFGPPVASLAKNVKRLLWVAPRRRALAIIAVMDLQVLLFVATP